MRHVRESLARGIARVSLSAPGCQCFPTNGRKVPQAGEAGLAVRGSESPSGRGSRSAHCALVWRRRSPARLGQDGQEAETQGTEGCTQRQGPRRRGGAERKGSDPKTDKRTEITGGRKSSGEREREKAAAAQGAPRGGPVQPPPQGWSQSSRRAPPQSTSHPQHRLRRQSGANELPGLGITSPEPAAIGWPSRRGGLLL